MVRRSSSAWLECQPVTLEVEGSSPFCVAINFRPNTFKVFGLTLAQIAQSVEQGTENPRVGSSILSLGTNKAPHQRSFLFCNDINFVLRC